MTFKFDTSGSVWVRLTASQNFTPMLWSDLKPFMQGYVEAMPWEHLRDQRDPDHLRRGPMGFSDLAPKTLARIMEDCASLLHFVNEFDNTPEDGGRFWNAGQRLGNPSAFPPLTLYLGEDGKIYFKEQ